MQAAHTRLTTIMADKDRDVYFSLSPSSRSKRDLDDDSTPTTKRVRLDADNSTSSDDFGELCVSACAVLRLRMC